MAFRDRKNSLLDQIRRMAALQQLRQQPDRELLGQFAGQGNEMAFRVLMDRYGPMVLRICKRILGNDHDAEDAYQAVFLVLTSKAASQCGQESVAGWLHGVAVRVARKARQAAQRRRRHERQTPEKKPSNPLVDLSMREAYDLLDEEISRLPEKYRSPLIQCQLMGRRQDEVARELSCTVRALKHRLEQGKDLLQKRLAARGVTVTGVLLSLMLSSGNEAAVVPLALAADTLRGVLLLVSRQEAATASLAATHLAGLTIKEILVSQIRSRVLWSVLALALTGGGLGAWQMFAHGPESANSLSAPLPGGICFGFA